MIGLVLIWTQAPLASPRCTDSPSSGSGKCPSDASGQTIGIRTHRGLSRLKTPLTYALGEKLLASLRTVFMAVCMESSWRRVISSWRRVIHGITEVGLSFRLPAIVLHLPPNKSCVHQPVLQGRCRTMEGWPPRRFHEHSSIYLYIHSSIILSIHPSIYLSIHPCIYPSIFPSIHLTYVYMWVCMYMRAFTYIHKHVSVQPVYIYLVYHTYMHT